MAFTPGSKMILCGGIEIDDYNQLTFQSADAQESYFQSHAKGTLLEDTYSYIRVTKDYVDIRSSFDSIVECNYMMVENTIYWAKQADNIRWWYLRIINKEFVNRDTTRVYFIVDAFQTFMHTIRWVPCFIEREMQCKDWQSIGSIPSFNNLTDEGLGSDLPTQVIDARMNDLSEAGFRFLVFSAWDETASSPAEGEVINGIYTGLKMYSFSEGEVDSMNELIKAHTEQGKLNDIAYIMAVPGECMQNRVTPKQFSVNFTDFKGYTPKNAKLCTYPYSYMRVKNYMGDDITLRFEMFVNPTETTKNFELASRFAGGPVLAFYPFGYAGLMTNYDYAIVLTDFPLCSFVGTAAGQAVAQNSINMINGIAGTLGNVAKAGVGPMFAQSNYGSYTGGGNGVSWQAQSALAMGQAAVNGVVDTAVNVVSTSLAANFSADIIKGNYGNAYSWIALQRYGFAVQHEAILPDAARRIDDFFTMYGYKTARLKKPNVRTRPAWNFVKCSVAHIDGRMDAEFKNQIEAMLNRGVTFWHVDRGAAVGDYTQDNQADMIEWGEE